MSPPPVHSRQVSNIFDSVYDVSLNTRDPLPVKLLRVFKGLYYPLPIHGSTQRPSQNGVASVVGVVYSVCRSTPTTPSMPLRTAWARPYAASAYVETCTSRTSVSAMAVSVFFVPSKRYQ